MRARAPSSSARKSRNLSLGVGLSPSLSSPSGNRRVTSYVTAREEDDKAAMLVRQAKDQFGIGKSFVALSSIEFRLMF